MSRLRVGCVWLLWTAFLFCLEPSLPIQAQAPPQLSPSVQAVLQIKQPLADVSTPTSATAAFDPPVAHPGETAYYRINLESTESAVRLPPKIPAPLALLIHPIAQGQIIQLSGGSPRPLTSFLFEVMPATTGRFTIPEFNIVVDGYTIPVESASIDVVDNSATNVVASPEKLIVDVSETNLFVGQPFRIMVMLPASHGNQIEALREVEINGDGIFCDRSSVRQSVSMVKDGQKLKPAYVYEITATPIAAGPLKFSAQAFSAGHEFGGPVSITGQVVIRGGTPSYDLMVSDSMEITARPLPTKNEKPGFTGSIGQFFYDPPQLSTNRLHVGEPVQLKVAFHPLNDLSRLVPPEPPRSRDWVIIANKSPNSGFTLVPLTDEMRETPVIPFSYFDPDTETYMELNIPALPVTITGGSLPSELQAMNDQGEAAPMKLTGLVATSGKTVNTLKPLQLQGWFVGLQLLPVIGFVALWRWDRRRRFLELHPEIIRRRQARRALRREKRNLQRAIAIGDAPSFTRHAVEALKIACAPHYPAHPQALVCGDVLTQLNAADCESRLGESLRQLFAAADAQFAHAPMPGENLLALQADVNAVLQKLEAKL